MSKHMPEVGEVWRSRNNSDEARVLAVVVDPEGKADTHVVYTFESFRENVVAMAAIPDFRFAWKPKPPFDPGDVIEYPSGLRYYVGEDERLYRLYTEPTVMGNLHVAKKIN